MKDELEKLLIKYPPNKSCMNIPWLKCPKHGENTSVIYRGTECPLCKAEKELFHLTYRDYMNGGFRP